MAANAEQQQTCAYSCPECCLSFEPCQFSIQCDACRQWYHGKCVNVEEYEAMDIDHFYCTQCETQTGSSILKQATNDHRQDKTEKDAECKSTQAGSPAFVEILLNEIKQLHSGDEIVKRLRGQQLTLPALLRNNFKVPLLVESKEGLELKVPSESFNEKDLLEKLGPDYELDVIDTRRQLSVRMRLIRFVEYMQKAVDQRLNVYNCISLELSKTCLAEAVKAPDVVNKLCWVNTSWPRDNDLDLKPAVSKYCLISMQGSYTDFHIDFGGTSVWYHVLKGEKLFLLIEPTDENLILYEKWMRDKNQSENFFWKIVDKCYIYRLSKGQTMFIPTGWIHAVYTPCDSIVFGGNFLHSLNISLQLCIYDMEKRLKTADKYRFPHFERTHWYAASYVIRLLRDRYKETKPPDHLLSGVKSMTRALQNWFKRECDGTLDDLLMLPPPYIAQPEKLIDDLNKQLRKANRSLHKNSSVHKTKVYKDIASEQGKSMRLCMPDKRSVHSDSAIIAQQTEISGKLLTIDEKKCVKQETASELERIRYLFDGKESNKEIIRETLPTENASQKGELIVSTEKKIKRKVQNSTKQRLLKRLKSMKTRK